MTSKEALDRIKHIDIDGRYPYPNFLKDDVRYKESIEVIEKRLNELEARDKPMLPIKLKWENTENYYYVCPKCEEMVARNDEVFCQDCGQRLDWSK